MIRHSLTALLVSENRALRAENEMLRRRLYGNGRAEGTAGSGRVGEESSRGAPRFDEVRISHAERTLLLDRKGAGISRTGSPTYTDQVGDRAGRPARQESFWARLFPSR